MFSGKTTKLIKLANKVNACYVGNHYSDTRYGEDHVITHDGRALTALMLEDSSGIRNMADSMLNVFVDEIQFFDNGIFAIMENRPMVNFYLTGLDKDYTGKYYPLMARLVFIADTHTRLTAKCSQCEGRASYTYYRGTKTPGIGHKDYEARCSHCHPLIR